MFAPDDPLAQSPVLGLLNRDPVEESDEDVPGTQDGTPDRHDTSVPALLSRPAKPTDLPHLLHVASIQRWDTFSLSNQG